MKTKDDVLKILSDRKTLLLQSYQISGLGLFGSYARGSQTESSDVDVLVDYEKAPSLFKLLELRDYLSDLLGMKVDIVTRNGLKPRIRERVLAEVIYL
jgi:predicted nucleotidyltransferase